MSMVCIIHDVGSTAILPRGARLAVTPAQVYPASDRDRPRNFPIILSGLALDAARHHSAIPERA